MEKDLHILNISSSISKAKLSTFSFSGIPLKEITGFLILPLFKTIKVISK